MALNLDFLNDIGGSGLNVFGARAPSTLDKLRDLGLLDYDEDKAQQQSLIQGLLGTGLSYLSQPKNQNYGSLFPYLAKAGIQGMKSSQSSYDGMTKEAMTNAKIEDLKRSRTKQSESDAFLKNLMKPTATIEQQGFLPSDAPIAPDASGQSTVPNYGLVPNMVETMNGPPDLTSNKFLASAIGTGNMTVNEAIKGIQENEKLRQESRKIKATQAALANKAPETIDAKRGNQTVKMQWTDGRWQDLSIGNTWDAKDAKPLHSNTTVVTDTGMTVYPPTSYGANQKVKPLNLDGSEYTGEFKIKGKALNDLQGGSIGYGSRMDIANHNFNNMLTNKDGTLRYSPSSVNSRNVVESWWAVGQPTAAVLNRLSMDANDRMAAQNMRNFINANLRRESGAAIAQSEFDSARAQYFPEVNDDAYTLKQKAENRAMAVATMRVGAGIYPNAIQDLTAMTNEMKAGTWVLDTGGKVQVPIDKSTTSTFDDTVNLLTGNPTPSPESKIIRQGDVVNGMRYLGGNDANNPENWEAL